MKNYKYTISALILFVAIFCIIKHQELHTKNLFIANTVGNNILEVNRLYELLLKKDKNFKGEQIKFNKEILTIIDCGTFVKDIEKSTVIKDAPYFIKGLEISINTLKKFGINESELVLCDKKVLHLVNKN